MVSKICKYGVKKSGSCKKKPGRRKNRRSLSKRKSRSKKRRSLSKRKSRSKKRRSLSKKKSRSKKRRSLSKRKSRSKKRRSLSKRKSRSKCKYGVKKSGSCKKKPGRSKKRRSLSKRKSRSKKRLRCSKGKVRDIYGDCIVKLSVEHLKLQKNGFINMKGVLTAKGKKFQKEHIAALKRISKSDCVKYLSKKGFKCEKDSCDILVNIRKFNKMYNTLIKKDTRSSKLEANKLKKCYTTYLSKSFKAYGVKDGKEVADKIISNEVSAQTKRDMDRVIKDLDNLAFEKGLDEILDEIEDDGYETAEDGGPYPGDEFDF